MLQHAKYTEELFFQQRQDTKRTSVSKCVKNKHLIHHIRNYKVMSAYSYFVLHMFVHVLAHVINEYTLKFQLKFKVFKN